MNNISHRHYYLIGILTVVNITLIVAVVRFGGGENTAEELEIKNTGSLSFDSELRALFYSYGIPEQWIREHNFADGQRKELRVWMPIGISLTVLNLEIHQIADQFRYQTSAREDSRTGNLSIHIRSDDIVIRSVIIQPRSDLKRNAF